MSPREYLRELAFPATSTTTIFALIAFFILLWLALAAGLFGLWLAIVTIPALLRYLTMIAEARAGGIDTAVPGIEFFTLVGQWWTLFPTVLVIALAWLFRFTGHVVGEPAAMLVLVGGAILLPAPVGILVATHSPIASLDPRGIGQYIGDAGAGYWYAPATLVLSAVVTVLPDFLPMWALALVALYLSAASFAVIGAVTRQIGLVERVDIADASEPDPDRILETEARERARALTHAYGFASRGNRDGALAHIYDRLASDPDPDVAWPWFLEQMLAWDDPFPGLLLAQQYLGRLLELGDELAAVKLMLRCRMLHDGFRPLSADLPAAIDAARSRGNEELVAALSD
jgi:hypothetical protein